MADIVCAEGSGQREDSEVWEIQCVCEFSGQRVYSEEWQIQCV